MEPYQVSRCLNLSPIVGLPAWFVWQVESVGCNWFYLFGTIYWSQKSCPKACGNGPDEKLRSSVFLGLGFPNSILRSGLLTGVQKSYIKRRWTYEYQLSPLPFHGWGCSGPYCRDLAFCSTKWLWHPFPTKWYVHKPWPYEMVLPVNCIG